MRIKEGSVHPGDTIRMMAVGSEFSVVECGYLRASSLEPAGCLSAGEVGYITASIKNVREARVGDTITRADNPAKDALPGYRAVQPMVFCGIYPADGAHYSDLRDALEKLQLNDASLTFEPETSVALGFGFRCGFLGLLHMEIIQERLEREYNLDLITTAPSVVYHITKTDGTVLSIDNPTNYPDPALIQLAEEPITNAHIYSPTEFVGNIMELCQERRGVFKDMKYLDTDRVDIHYELPLNEIVYDFFDALKSRTRGYASFDYELLGYEKSSLVKLDIMLNGEVVDALSFIIHADKAYPRARKMVEKLKEKIPRQLFEVPVQACIGGKIIARETVKAMRKDVLAKCYGGDITRKKKLLEKQKEGKKRMRQLGTVEEISAGGAFFGRSRRARRARPAADVRVVACTRNLAFGGNQRGGRVLRALPAGTARGGCPRDRLHAQSRFWRKSARWARSSAAPVWPAAILWRKYAFDLHPHPILQIQMPLLRFLLRTAAGGKRAGAV